MADEKKDTSDYSQYYLLFVLIVVLVLAGMYVYCGQMDVRKDGADEMVIEMHHEAETV